MSARCVLWILWTALSLCLPSAGRVQLCLCDGVGGLFDGAACAALEGASVATTCCGEAGGRDGVTAGVGGAPACHCVSLELQHDSVTRHASVTGTSAAPRLDASQPSYDARVSIRARRAPRARERGGTTRSVQRPLRI